MYDLRVSPYLILTVGGGDCSSWPSNKRRTEWGMHRLPLQNCRESGVVKSRTNLMPHLLDRRKRWCIRVDHCENRPSSCPENAWYVGRGRSPKSNSRRLELKTFSRTRTPGCLQRGEVGNFGNWRHWVAMQLGFHNSSLNQIIEDSEVRRSIDFMFAFWLCWCDEKFSKDFFMCTKIAEKAQINNHSKHRNLRENSKGKNHRREILF